MPPFKRLEGCEAPQLGMSNGFMTIPACMATEGGEKIATGWSCRNCPPEVKEAMAKWSIEHTFQPPAERPLNLDWPHRLVIDRKQLSSQE